MNITWATILSYLHNPLFCALAAYWLFSAITSRMPTPKEGDSKSYVTAYGTMHFISGSVARLAPILAPKFPLFGLILGWTEPIVQQANNPIATVAAGVIQESSDLAAKAATSGTGITGSV